MTAPSRATPAAGLSPCIGVCMMGASGHCLGCARTLEEIGTWSGLPAAGRLAVMEKLAERKATLGLDSHR